MRLLLIILLNSSLLSFGQNYLNDTMLFGGTAARITSVYEVDTGYFLMAERFTANHGNMTEIVLSYVDNNSIISTIISDFDTLNIN